MVASAIALAESVPDASLGRPASGSRSARNMILASRGRPGRGRLRTGGPGPGTRPVRGPGRHPRRLLGDRGPGHPGRFLRRRSNRCAGFPPSPSDRSGRRNQSSSPRRPNWTPNTARWLNWIIAEARENETDLDLTEAPPLDHFRAPLDLIPDSTAVIPDRRRGNRAGPEGPLGGRHHGDACR